MLGESIPTLESEVRSDPKYQTLRDNLTAKGIDLASIRVSDYSEDGRGYEMIYIATPELRAFVFELDHNSGSEPLIGDAEINRESDLEDWTHATRPFQNETA